MNIEIKQLDINDEEQIRSIVRWENDKDLYHLITPVRDKSKPEINTFESLKKRYAENPEYSSGIYIIFDNNKPIGNFSLQIDPGHLMKKINGTSWLGLTIGEKEYWGRGVAKMAMEYFEKESRRLGANRIELGTFEFNYRAQAFYKKLGFIEIGRLDKFTYWDGKYWDDIRMEKYLL
ncbi:MAG: GNAT family N-acetyltransferase [Bdellovibrionota bacterium]